jgi:hypothetical protein
MGKYRFVKIDAYVAYKLTLCRIDDQSKCEADRKLMVSQTKDHARLGRGEEGNARNECNFAVMLATKYSNFEYVLGCLV